MDKFTDYINLLKVDYNKIVNETLQNKGIQQQIIDLNQEQLSEKGIDSQEKIIKTIDGNPYTDYTKEIKSEKGQRTDIVTLYDEGVMYNSMRVNVNDEGAEVIADMSKGGGSIMDNFDSSYDFLGLINESLEKLKEWVLLDLFGRLLRQKLGL